MELNQKIINYVKNEYGTTPEHLWEKFPNFTVLRRQDVGKWFGILMCVNYKKLGISKDEQVWILNVKLDETDINFLLNEKGFLPAYHMNKRTWISILLDGSVKFDLICALINQSYSGLSKSKKK